CGAYPMLFRFYQALERPADSTDEAWEKHLARLEKWRTAMPESITPLVALGEAYLSYAWAARGNEFAIRVPKEAWPKWEDRLAKAHDCLKEAEAIGGDPEIYCALVQVAQGQGAEPEDVLALVDAARKLE